MWRASSQHTDALVAPLWLSIFCLPAHCHHQPAVVHSLLALLYFAQGRFHFVSSDYGSSFSAVAGPGGTEGYGQELRLHPRQTDWILAKVRRNECLVDRRRCVQSPAGC